METKRYEFLPRRDKRIIVTAIPHKAGELCFTSSVTNGYPPLVYKKDGYKVTFTSSCPGEKPFITWIEKEHFEHNYRELTEPAAQL